MKVGNLAGTIQRLADVLVPDDFAVCRVEKRDSIAPIVERVVCRSSRIPLGLCEDVLRPQGQSFCLNDPENLFVYAESVVSRAIFGRIFLYRTSVIYTKALS